MSLLRQPIERKLSSVIGAEVTFEKLKVSLIGGSLEASGVAIAGDDPATPLLTVRRIKAEISVAKALAKQIVIKSLLIEGPVISIVKRVDGSTNLPKKSVTDPVTAPPAEPEENPDEPASAEENEPASWRLEAQKVSLIDGTFQYRDETGGSTYLASAEKISGDLRQDDEKISIGITAEDVGRRDQPLTLGPIHLQGNFTDITDLAELLKSPMEAKVELTGGLVADVTSPGLAGKEISLELTGPLNLPELAIALPPSAHLLDFLKAPGFNGRANVSLKAGYFPNVGLKIDELNLRISEATVPLSHREK